MKHPPAFWNRPGSVMATALSPLGRVWGGLEWIHRTTARAEQVSVPVLCVGNLVSGGAGKTPVALDLGRRLQAQGVRINFLTRGYGGREIGPLCVDPEIHDAVRVGDEPLLLARLAPTWVSRRRVAGAKVAITHGAQVIVMDDGFQNPWLYKDLSVLVVDGAYGFGNGKVMPAGPLREPLTQGLARAQAVILIGKDDTGAAAVIAGVGRPILRAQLQPGPEIAYLQTRPLLAFAGIGRPAKFFDALEQWGCEVVKQKGFADHHYYRRGELEALLADADHLGATLVTTEKDHVRLPADLRDHVETVSISLAWEDDSAPDHLLELLLGSSHGRS